MRHEKGRGIIKKKHTLRYVLLSLAALFMLGLAAFCIFLSVIIMKAPPLDLQDVQPDGYRTTVLDTDGNVALTLTGEASNRIYVDLAYIPVDLQHAFVALEDERFYKHPGIDFKGIVRAVWTGVSTGHFNQGASTITQQLLKNNVLTSWTEEKTFMDKVERKIQEQYLAVILEMRTSKDWILENYLNTINLGGGCWGVETASRYYFDKDVSELTLSECAVLAGITKSPTTYNPLRNPEENAKRRDKTLRYMLNQGYISEEAFNEAMADDVYTRISEAHENRTGAEVFSYFEDALVYDVLSDIMAVRHCSKDEAWDLIYRGGLTIYSTEDTGLQAICEQEMNNDVNFSSDAEASIVLIDTATGEVRAMVGGRGEKTASLIYNRATSAIRQPGSTIKILGEYAAGLDSGLITLGTAVDDAPYSYSNGTEIHNSNGLYGGMTTIRTAIAQSDNIVAFKCFEKLGTEEVFSTLEDFGITTLTDDDKVEALALGGTANGVTNLEMTAAYGSLGRSGLYVEPVYYTKIIDHDGNVLIDNTPASHAVVRSDTAALLTSALEYVITDGTGIDADFDGVAIAGKSGTTSGARDGWFIGYSPYLTCGVWGGYDDNREQEDTSYVKRIWRSVMSRAHETYAYTAFDGLEDLTECEICIKCGKLATPGLCDATVHGDATRTEYFKKGTEPRSYCDCHVAVDICTFHWERAGRYCPKDQIVTRVYLKEASEGTEDVQYVIPESLADGTCTEHTSLWNYWFNRKPAGGSSGSSSGSGSGSSSGGSSSGSSGSSGSSSGSSGSSRDDDDDESSSGGSSDWWSWLFGDSSSTGDTGSEDEETDIYGDSETHGNTGRREEPQDYWSGWW